MSSETATMTEPVKKVYREKDWIFILINRKESQVQKKGPKFNPDRPMAAKGAANLDTSGISSLPMQSEWNQGKDKKGRSLGIIKTMYIPGAPTCFVNDYTIVNAEGTVEKIKGLRSLGYLDTIEMEREYLRQAMSLNIRFVNGLLYMDMYGVEHDPVLQEFILKHHNFTEGENWVRNPRRTNRLLFKRLNKEKDAEVPLENLEIEAEAMNLVNGLRTRIKSGDKKGQFQYNREKLDLLMGIFGMGIDDEDDAQKMQTLYLMAKNDPVDFMGIYEGVVGEYKLCITTAQNDTMKLLSATGKEAKLNLANDKRVIVTFKTTNKDEQLDELVAYFLSSPAGRNDYNQLHTEVEEKKMQLMSSKK